MRHQEVELLAIGAGPSNLALAVAVEELAGSELAQDTLVVEQRDDVAWQRGMLLPWTTSQVSFLKDLVTLRNPRSAYSFVNYLHSVGRLDQFINLGSFSAYRMEISAYLAWVAHSLQHVRVQYGRRCGSIRPHHTADGPSHWSVEMSDGSTIVCRHLVIGGGRDVHIPEAFAGLPRDKVIHSTEFAVRVDEIGTDRPLRLAVVGGAQSAAEMLTAVHQSFPLAHCTMIMRSIGLQAYEASKFTNELFYPSFVDQFHAALPEAREQLLREMHRTNYSGLTPELLESLYRRIYLDRLAGDERIEMLTMRDVVDAQLDGGEVAVTLLDRKTGGMTQHRFDKILLGTGFASAMPRIVQDLARSAGVADISVNRHYRMNLPAGYGATCHLQGVNESTHGIVDSLLSVLAIRAEEIVGDLLAHRSTPPVLVFADSTLTP
ncbi:lysine N(6)-hydroxylase/L-ornithine N(5)-oxygenase family protein [Dactylosporangium roseum]|uniref:L-lysine N6-monooxygenase MbtG n=1 Tax=Dactylosporangium roseum TaxID=47989 RepID=A0ABY5ZFD6_9ACTN|nr:lysine N(6)-hydroxylase/L-ornithine N(5)-oxygenase family protein [Dactylosporangium roseum]